MPAAVVFPAEVTEIAHSPEPFRGVISLPLSAQFGSNEAKVSVAPAFDTADTVDSWRYPRVIGAFVLTATPFIVAVISSTGRATFPAVAALKVSGMN